jgi:hypothetical protein
MTAAAVALLRFQLSGRRGRELQNPETALMLSRAARDAAIWRCSTLNVSILTIANCTKVTSYAKLR